MTNQSKKEVCERIEMSSEEISFRPNTGQCDPSPLSPLDNTTHFNVEH